MSQFPIKNFGEDAATEAALRAVGISERGDMDGRRVWSRIMRAIAALQRQRTTARGSRSLNRGRPVNWAA